MAGGWARHGRGEEGGDVFSVGLVPSPTAWQCGPFAASRLSHSRHASGFGCRHPPIPASPQVTSHSSGPKRQIVTAIGRGKTNRPGAPIPASPPAAAVLPPTSGPCWSNWMIRTSAEKAKTLSSQCPSAWAMRERPLSTASKPLPYGSS